MPTCISTINVYFKTLECKRLVLAIPPNQCAKLEFSPPLGYLKRRLFDSMEPVGWHPFRLFSLICCNGKNQLFNSHTISLASVVVRIKNPYFPLARVTRYHANWRNGSFSLIGIKMIVDLQGHFIKFVVTFATAFWRDDGLSGEIASTGRTTVPGEVVCTFFVALLQVFPPCRKR